MIVPEGVLFDLDGVIYQGDSLVVGAIEIIASLNVSGIPYRFITNTTRMTKSNLVLYLKNMGLNVEPENIFTAPHVAIEYCKIKGFKKILLVVPDSDMETDFSCFDLVDEKSDAIILGDMGPLFNFDLLNRLFLDVMRGSKIVAMHKNRYWMDVDGLRLDLGAFVSALEFASGKSAVVMGKPDPNIFNMASMKWKCSLSSIYVVGDDIDADVCGARNAGMKSVLVKTGKFREDALFRSKIKPDHIIESVADLSTLFNLVL